MTSSLVGSEMCIRDSSAPRQRNRAGGRNPDQPPPEARPSPGHHLFTRAVSYTHLTLPTICSV
eukprot:5248675-Prorocentrum_lima.AAC.1